MSHLKLGELLVQQGLITEDQLKEAMKAQKKESGRIGEVLMKLGILSEEELAKALGTQLSMPHATLENNLLQANLNQGLDKIVPYDFAKANFVLPIKKEGSNLTCAVADPLDLLMRDNLKMVTGHEINEFNDRRLFSFLNKFFDSWFLFSCGGLFFFGRGGCRGSRFWRATNIVQCPVNGHRAGVRIKFLNGGHKFGAGGDEELNFMTRYHLQVVQHQ